jgi:hypothetical protein
MSTQETPAPPLLTNLVTNRRQVAIGLATVGLLLAGLAIWWGVWGFARSADPAAATQEGKLSPEDIARPDDKEADAKARRSPDWQVPAVWAGAIALLCLLSATWMYTQPADPAAPNTSARVEALTFGGTAGFITALCGAFLGYRWYPSVTRWIGGGERREAKWVLIAATVFLIGLLIMFISLQLARTEQRSNAALRRVLYGFNTVFVGLLLLLVLVGVNVTTFLHVPETLVTNDSAFTELAPESKRFLQTLDRPVQVYLIMPEGYSETITRGLTYRNLYADCRGFLSQCEDQSDHFKATYLSPAFNPDRIATVRQKIKEGDRDQFGMLLTVGADEEVTTFIRATELIDVDAEGRNLVFQGENKLLTELMYLTDARAKEKVYFTQEHGELGIDAGSERDKSASGVVRFLRDRKMSVEPLTFPVGQPGKVPDDAAVVVVAGLRQTLPADDPMIGALRDFLRRPEKKGKLLICLPAFRDASGKVAPTGLEGLLAEFGVEVEPGRRLLQQPGRIRATPDHVLAGPFAGLSPELERAVGQMPLVLKDARPIRPVPGAPGRSPERASPLFGTAMLTWQETDFLKPADLAWTELRGDQTGELAQQKNATPRPVPVAVVVTDPVPPGGKGNPRPHLIVFGSETFLQDQVAVPVGPEEFRQQFVSDTIDWLRERDASIGIPPRKLGMFALEKQIDWPSQVVLLAMVTVGVTALGVGVWLSRRR